MEEHTDYSSDLDSFFATELACELTVQSDAVSSANLSIEAGSRSVPNQGNSTAKAVSGEVHNDRVLRNRTDKRSLINWASRLELETTTLKEMFGESLIEMLKDSQSNTQVSLINLSDKMDSLEHLLTTLPIRTEKSGPTHPRNKELIKINRSIGAINTRQEQSSKDIAHLKDEMKATLENSERTTTTMSKLSQNLESLAHAMKEFKSDSIAKIESCLHQLIPEIELVLEKECESTRAVKDIASSVDSIKSFLILLLQHTRGIENAIFALEVKKQEEAVETKTLEPAIPSECSGQDLIQRQINPKLRHSKYLSCDEELGRTRSITDDEHYFLPVSKKKKKIQ